MYTCMSTSNRCGFDWPDDHDLYINACLCIACLLEQNVTICRLESVAAVKMCKTARCPCKKAGQWNTSQESH